MPQVSIVIVCMNNLGNLYPCLDSIKKHTKVSYETFVVAYLFTNENKTKLKADYPWVTVVESDDIRGFSENNNLALRLAKGEYCFVVNDDTIMNESVIDKLVADFESVPSETAIISPRLVGVDGQTQVCGRPVFNSKRYVLGMLHLWNEKKRDKYTDGDGIFQSYNIIGAAFMIKTDVFRNAGWFDEYYFFCPEDIALSTKLNETGYKCYVDADIRIVHLEGMSGKSLSMVQTATKPAGDLGTLHFLTKGNKILYCILAVISFFMCLIRFTAHRVIGLTKKQPNYSYILSIGDWNTLVNIFSTKTPKEIFTRYFNEIRKVK